VLVASNSYRALYTRVVYTEWLFFALLAAGSFLLHGKAEYRPVVLTRGARVIAALFILASVGIAINQCVASPRDSAVGLGLLILGLPVYFVWSFRRRSDNPMTRRTDDPNN
jgi:APA family basic amino acid/polyamine antiporter